jgi:signal transduction histidine kinase
MSLSARRARTVSPARVDRLLALALAAAVTAECLTATRIHGGRAVASAAAGVLIVAPVAVRRRRPQAALLLATALAALQGPLGGELGHTGGTAVLLALVLLAYAPGAWLPLPSAAVSLAVSVLLFGCFVAGFEASVAAAIAPALLALVVPWVIGRVVRERARRTGALRALALQTEREQAERERAAVAQERLRIGAELQDIVAHSLSAMVIGAAGARRLLVSDPERARDSMRDIEQAGRQTLADLRQLLGVLKREDDPRALAPQPGLAELPRLLGEAGLRCELDASGDPAALTPGMDLVGYRVVETALGCAARRDGTHAAVRLAYGHDALRIEVTTDGRLTGDGEELQAIGERVSLYGGSFELTGPRDAGFALLVELPHEGARAA